MLLNYEIDPLKEVYACPYTPSPAAEDLPLLAESVARYRQGPRYFTERQGADTYLLLYTHEGEGRIHGPDGVYTAAPGTAALLDGMTYHRYETGSAGCWDISWLQYL